LVLVLVAFTLIVLLVQGLPLASHLRDVERDRFVTALQRDAFTLAGFSAQALASATPATAVDGLVTPVGEYAKRSQARVVVTDADATAVLTSDDTDVGDDYSNRPEIQSALDGRAVSGERESVTAGADLLYVAVPVRSGTDILGAVRITFPTERVDAIVDDRMRSLFVVALITLVAAAGIAILLAGLATGPLRRLRNASQTIAEGDLSARVEPSSIAELDELARTFNEMATRVESVIRSQRSFAGDASHQLRTPLTALRLRVDTAQDLLATDSEALDQTLDGMRDELDRMQRLIDGLLLLARADRDDLPLEVIDAAAVVSARVADWQPLAAEQGVDIAATIAPGSWRALCSPQALDQIVDNYLDNAVDLAPAGSTITVDVASSAFGVRVQVIDSGPGMSEDERRRAFDRFWRGDHDRTGSGLGLAVVRALADASGAKVRIEPRADGRSGAVAVVELTAAGADGPPLIESAPSADPGARGLTPPSA
jgi:signal transduction histidine kinase